MGGHEIYCYVCGCPLHNKGEIFDMKLLKKILKDLKSKLKKKNIIILQARLIIQKTFMKI